MRARAARVEDTAACAGKEELSDGMWFSLNVCRPCQGPGVTDALSQMEGSSCVLDVVTVDGSCTEDRLSEVGI